MSSSSGKGHKESGGPAGAAGGDGDSIIIPRIGARCVLGVRPHERRRRRRVEISLSIEADLREAAASDALEHTVDYSAAARLVREAVARTDFELLEALAGHVAGIVLGLPRVRAVVVSVSKPGALRGAGAPEVRIRREKA